MLDFTGERFIPTEVGEIRYEHMHRYGWVQGLCAGLAVLDIACGEGYGSALLAKMANTVIGVDISQDAVDHASRNYSGQKNLGFLQGSATEIPAADHSFDIVVSFETLEHLAEQEQMLAELRRVLKPTGILVISSPNKKVYSDERNYVNEFHVKELYFDEFDALLRRHFGAARYFGQRFLTGSAMLPLDASADHYDAILLEDGQAKAATLLSDQNMYFVAVCASSADLLPACRPNLYLEHASDLYTEGQDVRRWASRLDVEHQSLSRQHVRLQAEFDERSEWALGLDAERQRWVAERARLMDEREQLERLASERARGLADSEGVLARARADALEARHEVERLINSRSWRLTAPLRWFAKRFA